MKPAFKAPQDAATILRDVGRQKFDDALYVIGHLPGLGIQVNNLATAILFDLYEIDDHGQAHSLTPEMVYSRGLITEALVKLVQWARAAKE